MGWNHTIPHSLVGGKREREKKNAGLLDSVRKCVIVCATMTINPVALRTIRERTGLSIRQLGEVSTVAFSQISLIERGAATPNPATIKKLADALGVPITAIISPEPEAVEA